MIVEGDGAKSRRSMNAVAHDVMAKIEWDRVQ